MGKSSKKKLTEEEVAVSLILFDAEPDSKLSAPHFCILDREKTLNANFL
jgi:hypothetical protein